MAYIRETFEELDIMNNFMFNNLTTVPETAIPFCKCMIKNLLGKEVEEINVHTEKFIVPNDPKKRGVRLDVQVNEIADDSIISVIDIEPHRTTETTYPKKNRFQQALIDKNNLSSGDNDFSHLPELYIICITNYDPFGYDQMLYEIKNKCVDLPELEYNDGVHIMYFNTTGKKGGSEALKRFLTYLEDSRDDNAVDEATQEMKNYVELIKRNQEIGGHYMTFGDLMDKMAAEAAAEASKELNTELYGVKTELSNAKAELSNIQTELSNTQSELSNAQSELSNAQNALNQKDDEIAQLKQRIHELENK